jgi:hypothetical protein
MAKRAGLSHCHSERAYFILATAYERPALARCPIGACGSAPRVASPSRHWWAPSSSGRRFVTGATLAKAISEQVDVTASHLHTDSWVGYHQIGEQIVLHETVNHRQGEYVRGNVTTNHAEGYFSQLKRGIDGTHHYVSREHLPRYLAEFDFRYSTRKMSDAARMMKLVGQTTGRRLTYRSASSC